MPKTKRAQVVHLTKTSKKPKSAKSTLISNIHTTIHAHERIYAFSVSNMRNVYFQNIRQELKPTCRIFYGKNRVMAHALNTVEHDNEKVKEGLKKVALTVKGQIGLLLSNMPHEELVSHLVSVGKGILQGLVVWPRKLSPSLQVSYINTMTLNPSSPPPLNNNSRMQECQGWEGTR